MKLIHEDIFKIYYENTDSSGFTYHTSYLCFAERARSNMLNEKFPETSILLKQNSYFFVIKRLQTDFYKPSYLYDNLKVLTYFKNSSKCSLNLVQELIKENISICKICLCLVWINGKTKRPTRIPSNLISRFNSGEIV